MTAANVYVLGGNNKLILRSIDQDGEYFIPTEMRLSVKQPDGDIITVSGGEMDFVSSGESYYLYRYPTIGWFEYEGWVKDGHGFEDTATNGFEVIDHVY